MKKGILPLLILIIALVGLLFGCMENKRDFTPDNNAPMINEFDVYPIQVIRNNTATIKVNYKDLDGDAVSFTIVPFDFPQSYRDYNPDWMDHAPVEIPGTGTTQFTWQAPHLHGRYWFKATGTDGNFVTEALFSIIVLSRPPNMAWTPNPTTQFKFEDQDSFMQIIATLEELDIPPVSYIDAVISITPANTEPVINSILKFIPGDDGDVIDILTNTTAVVTMETVTRKVKVTATLNMLQADIDALDSTWEIGDPSYIERFYNITLNVVDESGYANSLTHTVELFK